MNSTRLGEQKHNTGWKNKGNKATEDNGWKKNNVKKKKTTGGKREENMKACEQVHRATGEKRESNGWKRRQHESM